MRPISYRDAGDALQAGRRDAPIACSLRELEALPAKREGLIVVALSVR
jgi:hypothetical protein